MPKKNATKTEKPILQYIREHIENGELPENFSLPQDNHSEMNFAPGARDGIYIFHVPKNEVEEDDKKRIEEALCAASDGQYEKAESIFKELSEKTPAVFLMSDTQQYIADHIDKLSDENLFQFACWLIETSADKECVKFGLGISNLFECRDEGFRDAIRTLGLSDEFTVFSVISMLMWHGEATYEVFDLAKKVHGWGRIHAVDRLNPDTQEIRDWLFYEGIQNNVLPNYSAFTVFMNSGAEKRLEEPMDRKDYEAMCALLEPLLTDEPVPGISSLANAGDILKKFLTRAGEQDLSEDDLTLIREIRLFAENKERPLPQVKELCDALLNRI